MSLRGENIGINNSSDTSPITINGTSVVFSKAFRLNYGQVFGIWLKMGNGSGTANMKIQLEQSYKAPPTEGASDADWVIADGVPDIYSNLNDGASPIPHIKSISPAPMKWARLKITGLGTNPADATLQAFLFQQEIVT